MDLQSCHTFVLFTHARGGRVHKLTNHSKMSEKGEVDLTGAKQNTGVWLVKVSILPLQYS